MRYNYSISDIEDSIPVGSCIFRKSFLLENTKDVPYDYRKDHVVQQAISKTNYFRIGTYDQVLRRVEDKVVTDFIPVLKDIPEGTRLLDPINKIIHARQVAEDKFLELNRDYHKAKTKLENLIKQEIQDRGLYLSMFANNAEDQDVFRRFQQALSQLLIENCRYICLNRYSVLRKLEDTLDLKGTLHNTGLHICHPDSNPRDYLYDPIWNIHEQDAFIAPETFQQPTNQFPVTDWSTARRQSQWYYHQGWGDNLARSAASKCFTPPEVTTTPNLDWECYNYHHGERYTLHTVPTQPHLYEAETADPELPRFISDPDLLPRELLEEVEIRAEE